MEETEKLILIDAVHSQSAAGNIVRFTLPRDLDTIGQLTWGSSTASTHAFGLGEALTLANTLELLPQQVILYGIELGHIQQGKPLSLTGMPGHTVRDLSNHTRRIRAFDMREPN